MAALRMIAKSWGWSSGAADSGMRGDSNSTEEAWRAVKEWWKRGGGVLGFGSKAEILWARHLWR